jgi:hypothetical protein
MLRGGRENCCCDQVLEHSWTGLDHDEIIGVAAAMGWLSEYSPCKTPATVSRVGSEKCYGILEVKLIQQAGEG